MSKLKLCWTEDKDKPIFGKLGDQKISGIKTISISEIENGELETTLVLNTRDVLVYGNLSSLLASEKSEKPKSSIDPTDSRKDIENYLAELISEKHNPESLSIDWDLIGSSVSKLVAGEIVKQMLPGGLLTK